jgi:iturin family lipopeptide synthetase A
MDELKKYILEQVASKKLPIDKAEKYLKDITSEESKDIAIIGLACRYPKSNNPREFWDNLINRRDCLDVFPESRYKYAETFQIQIGGATSTSGLESLRSSYGFKAGYLEDVDKFDAAFFNIPPREAKHMDPRQRFFLEVAWSAVEDAGYNKDTFYGSNTGVYVGEDKTGSTFYRMLVEDDPLIYTGTWEGILASRISYIYNLRGPAMVVDTACSSGLTALNLAVKAIRNRECEMAIAGGVAMGTLPQRQTSESDDVIASVQSTDNSVRSFDKDASGTIFGEGVGAILIKSLDKAIENGDHIYAVIKGTAINNDGASNGITAPSVKAQEEVIISVLNDAKLSPEDIDYIEAHGTGTLLGDPIEIKGITNAYTKYTNKKQFCAIGTAKTNIGHTVGASGIAGLIKVVLAMVNEKIPPMREFNEPNPHIDFVNSPLYVAANEIPWPKGGNRKRTAAVSAFGFSGTNCHVILQEAPEITEKEEMLTKADQVVTFSAKSMESLLDILKSFKWFLDRGEELNLTQVAYTLNACRGHYEHRLAMIVSSVEEMKEKIASIIKTGLEFIEEDRVFYGIHKVVSDKKQSKQEHDITESEKRNITVAANEGIELWRKNKDSVSLSSIIGICKRYVKGGDVNWGRFYDDRKIRKISLPTYAFEKKLYWGKLKEEVVRERAFEKTIEHPFIEKLIISTSEVDIYSVKLSIDSHWAVKEHAILGRNMMSGTSFVEMIRAVGALYFDNITLRMNEVMFQVPLIIEKDEQKEARIIVKKNFDHYEIKVESRNEANGTWTIHATGSVSKFQSVSKRINIQALLQRDDFIHLKAKDMFVEASTKGVIGFGERWDVVKSIRKNEKEVIVEIELDEKFIEDLDTYLLHPSLLDNAANNMGTVTFGQGMYLPFSYKEIRFFRPMTKSIISYATYIPKSTEDTKKEMLTFNICITDTKGNVIAEIDEYRTKKVKRPSEISGKTNQYHKVDWIKGEPEVNINWTGNKVLLFKDELGEGRKLIDRIKALGSEVIEVTMGERYDKLSENNYIIDNLEESYENLARSLEVSEISHIIHMSSISEKANFADLTEFRKEKGKSVDSVFFLTKALITNGMRNKVELIFITKNAYNVTGKEEYISPLSTSMAALGKVIPLEYPNIVCKGIDISNNVQPEDILKEISKEINGGNELQHIYRVALRNNDRYFERVYKIDKIEDFRRLNTKIKEQGAYVITGGTGAIGVQAAKYIAGEAKANLCFIVRSQLPPRDEWDAIIESGRDRKKIDIFNNIRDIESSGAKVMCYAANISSYEDVKRVIDEIKNTYGKINGIVHCAGVPGEGYIIRKDKKTFDSVISPKVEGTWILDDLTKDQDMDFMVLCSSMMTFIGAPGQSDYVVGNTF